VVGDGPLSPAMSALRRRRWWVIAAASSAAAALGAAWLVRGQAPEERAGGPPEAPESPFNPPAPRIDVWRPAPAPPPAGPLPGAAEPHPITPERLRMEEQHQLFDQVAAAIQALQFDRARALLHEHQERFSDAEAWTDLHEAWRVIADCLEYPGPQSKARGLRFVDQERGSSMRRRVRRACLEVAPSRPTSTPR
jgi:hypothetical protein